MSGDSDNITSNLRRFDCHPVFATARRSLRKLLLRLASTAYASVVHGCDNTGSDSPTELLVMCNLMPLTAVCLGEAQKAAETRLRSVVVKC